MREQQSGTGALAFFGKSGFRVLSFGRLLSFRRFFQVMHARRRLRLYALSLKRKYLHIFCNAISFVWGQLKINEGFCPFY